jgi:hypothetical protein
VPPSASKCKESIPEEGSGGTSMLARATALHRSFIDCCQNLKVRVAKRFLGIN